MCAHVCVYTFTCVHLCARTCAHVYVCVFVCEEREVDFEQFLLVKSIG